MAAFVDIQGAFDNVNPVIMLKEKLKEIGCSGTILKFVQHFTYRRSIYIEYNLNQPRFAWAAS